MKFYSLEEASKKINKDGKKTIIALDAYGKSSGKIGQDLVDDLGASAPANVELFRCAMLKQEQLAQNEVNLCMLTNQPMFFVCSSCIVQNE